MRYLILLLLYFYTDHCSAQPYEGMVKYKGIQSPAAKLEVAYPTDIVMAAMTSYLSRKMKSAETDVKGFATFRNSQMPDTGQNADLFFKVESKGGSRERTIVSLLITYPKTNQQPPDSLYYLNMTEAKAFLGDLELAIGSYDIDRKVKALQDEIYFAESVYNNIEDDVKRDDGDKIKLDNKSVSNKKALLYKKSEIETLKRALEVLKKSRTQE